MKNVNKLYKIPNFKSVDLSSYRVTKDGRLFGLKYGMFLKPQRNMNGYYYYSLRINNKHIHLPIHRLLCATFKPVNGWENMVVDHINGDRGDNRLENLEFVTPKENIIRFRKGDYNYMQQQVAIRYIKENKIVITPNLYEAAKLLNIDIKTLLRRLNVFKEGYVFDDFTQVKLADDGKKFINHKDYDKQREIQRRIQKVKLYNHLTGEHKEFDKISDACKFLDLSASSVSFRLNTVGLRRVTPKGWEIKYKTDDTPWYKLSKQEKKRFDNVNTIVTPLAVTSIITGEVKKFNSIREAAKYYKCTSTKIWHRLSVNRDKPSRDGYTYKYI